jgi:hypothetical protein
MNEVKGGTGERDTMFNRVSKQVSPFPFWMLDFRNGTWRTETPNPISWKKGIDPCE